MPSEFWKNISITVILIIAFGGLITALALSKNKKSTPLFAQLSKICSTDWCIQENEEKIMLDKDGVLKPVDGEKWEKLKDEILNIKNETSLSENKDNFSKYGIENKFVEINGTKILIGNITEDLSQTYIATDDKVYKINTVWDKNGITNENYWLNTTLTNLPIYQIKKLLIERNGISKEISIDSNNQPDYLNKLAYIMRVNWINDKKIDKAEQKAKIVFVTEDGNKTITFGEAFYNGKKIYWGKDDSWYYDIGKDVYNLVANIL